MNEQYDYETMSVEEQIARIEEAAKNIKSEETGEPISVQYMSGESRANPGESVDYMIADADGIELYAERDPDQNEHESLMFDELRFEICQQAIANGIDHNRLRF